MSWFNNLSIRVKVLSIALIALLGFLLYLGAGFYASRNVALHLEDIQKSDVPALQRVNAITVALVNLRESYAAAITDRDELILSEARESAVGIEQKLAQPLSNSAQAVVEQEKLLVSFRAYNRQADTLAQQMVSATLSPEQAKEGLQELSQQQRAFDTQMDVTKQAVYDSFARKIVQVKQSNDELWRLGLVMGTLVAIVVLALSLLITNRMIIGPLTHAVDAANKIAEGDWAISIVNTSRDELGRMLQSIQKMRDRLKARFDEDRRAERIKTTVAELGNRMRGDMTMEQLSENILNYLVPSLNGQVGLLYMPQGDELTLTGSYAFTFRKNLSNKIKLGEGLVGQAALEKKQIVLARVPDDYIVVSSGLGETAPRHIVVTPILHEGELRALLEIGSLGEFGAEELEILQLGVE
ncbi:MAG TPA: GAF domain-containing protein, partial [Moraxellaceae bacterium]